MKVYHKILIAGNEGKITAEVLRITSFEKAQEIKQKINAALPFGYIATVHDYKE